MASSQTTSSGLSTPGAAADGCCPCGPNCKCGPNCSCDCNNCKQGDSSVQQSSGAINATCPCGPACNCEARKAKTSSVATGIASGSLPSGSATDTTPTTGGMFAKQPDKGKNCACLGSCGPKCNCSEQGCGGQDGAACKCTGCA